MTTLYDGYFKVEGIKTEYGKFEVIRATNSVSVLLYYPITDKVLLIKQPRAAMITEDNPHGMVIESVSGRFDVDLTPQALIAKEADEEAGVIIDEEDIILLNNGQPMSVSAGMTNEMCYLGYAEIYPEMIYNGAKIFGSPEEGEHIERVWLDRKIFIDQSVTCLRVFTFQQWLKNHIKN